MEDAPFVVAFDKAAVLDGFELTDAFDEAPFRLVLVPEIVFALDRFEVTVGFELAVAEGLDVAEAEGLALAVAPLVEEAVPAMLLLPFPLPFPLAIPTFPFPLPVPIAWAEPGEGVIVEPMRARDARMIVERIGEFTRLTRS